MENYGLEALGIDAVAIEMAYEECYDCIEAVKNFAQRIGYEEDVKTLDFDLGAEVQNYLYQHKGSFNLNDITQSLVKPCYSITKAAIEKTAICKDFNVRIELEASNYNPSKNQLFIFVDNEDCSLVWSGSRVPDSTDLQFALFDKVVEKITAIAMESGNYNVNDNLKKAINEAIFSGHQVATATFPSKQYEYDVKSSDIRDCLNNKAIGGTLKTMVDEEISVYGVQPKIEFTDDFSVAAVFKYSAKSWRDAGTYDELGHESSIGYMYDKIAPDETRDFMVAQMPWSYIYSIENNTSEADKALLDAMRRGGYIVTGENVDEDGRVYVAYGDAVANLSFTIYNDGEVVMNIGIDNLGDKEKGIININGDDSGVSHTVLNKDEAEYVQQYVTELLKQKPEILYDCTASSKVKEQAERD